LTTLTSCIPFPAHQRDTGTILITEDQSIEGVNLAEDEREGLLDDLVAVIYSFCARQTERLTAELKRDDDDAIS
jgi:hypothetical protein